MKNTPDSPAHDAAPSRSRTGHNTGHSTAQHHPRPILRRSSIGSPADAFELPPNYTLDEMAAAPSASSSRGQIRWDEETIRMHDAERGTRMKIDEPKTPYTYYDSSNEELDMGTVDPEELARALESVPVGADNQYTSINSSPNSSMSSSSYASASESASTSMGSSSHAPRSSAMVSPVPRKSRSLSLSFSDISNSESSSSRGKESSDADNEELDEAARDRKRRFDQMRATHYNMKEALLRARWARQRSSADGNDGNGDSADDEGESESYASTTQYYNNATTTTNTTTTTTTTASTTSTGDADAYDDSDHENDQDKLDKKDKDNDGQYKSNDDRSFSRQRDRIQSPSPKNMKGRRDQSPSATSNH